MSGEKSLTEYEIVSILDCDEEISSLSSSDSEIDDLINTESECRSDTSGSTRSDDGYEADVAASIAAGSRWYDMNNHEVGPNISISTQNIELGLTLPSH